MHGVKQYFRISTRCENSLHLLVTNSSAESSFFVSQRPRVKCELRKCEWVLCELKCEPACDWSDIFRLTRSLPCTTAFAHSWNFLSGNNCRCDSLLLLATIIQIQTCINRIHNTCVCLGNSPKPSVLVTDGMSKHRLSLYNAHFLDVVLFYSFTVSDSSSSA